MTSTWKADGPADDPGRAQWRNGCGRAMRWKPVEIAAMVVGFMFYWPVGLAILGLMIAQRRGYRVEDAVRTMRGAAERFGARPAGNPQWRPFSTAGTGNAAFDEWRAAELAKLEEERRKLDAAQRDFAEHLDNLRRARDREEFEGFMNTRQARQG